LGVDIIKLVSYINNIGNEENIMERAKKLALGLYEYKGYRIENMNLFAAGYDWQIRDADGEWVETCLTRRVAIERINEWVGA
jgi:hypothetical protein